MSAKRLISLFLIFSLGFNEIPAAAALPAGTSHAIPAALFETQSLNTLPGSSDWFPHRLTAAIRFQVIGRMKLLAPGTLAVWSRWEWTNPKHHPAAIQRASALESVILLGLSTITDLTLHHLFHIDGIAPHALIVLGWAVLLFDAHLIFGVIDNETAIKPDHPFALIVHAAVRATLTALSTTAIGLVLVLWGLHRNDAWGDLLVPAGFLSGSWAHAALSARLRIFPLIRAYVRRMIRNRNNAQYPTEISILRRLLRDTKQPDIEAAILDAVVALGPSVIPQVLAFDPPLSPDEYPVFAEIFAHLGAELPLGTELSEEVRHWSEVRADMAKTALGDAEAIRTMDWLFALPQFRDFPRFRFVQLMSQADEAVVPPLLQALREETAGIRALVVNILAARGWTPKTREEKFWYAVNQERWRDAVQPGTISSSAIKMMFENDVHPIWPLVVALQNAYPEYAEITVAELHALVMLHPEWIEYPNPHAIKTFRIFLSFLPPVGGKVALHNLEPYSRVDALPPTLTAEEQGEILRRMTEEGRLGNVYVHQLTVQGKRPDPFKYVALALIITGDPSRNDWTHAFYETPWAKVAPLIHDANLPHRTQSDINPSWSTVPGRTDFLHRYVPVTANDLRAHMLAAHASDLDFEALVRDHPDLLGAYRNELEQEYRRRVELPAYQRLALALSAAMGTCPPHIPNELQQRLAAHWQYFQAAMESLLREKHLEDVSRAIWFGEPRSLPGWSALHGLRQEGDWKAIRDTLIRLEQVRQDEIAGGRADWIVRTLQLLVQVTRDIDSDLNREAEAMAEAPSFLKSVRQSTRRLFDRYGTGGFVVGISFGLIAASTTSNAIDTIIREYIVHLRGILNPSDPVLKVMDPSWAHFPGVRVLTAIVDWLAAPFHAVASNAFGRMEWLPFSALIADAALLTGGWAIRWLRRAEGANTITRAAMGFNISFWLTFVLLPVLTIYRETGLPESGGYMALSYFWNMFSPLAANSAAIAALLLSTALLHDVITWNKLGKRKRSLRLLGITGALAVLLTLSSPALRGWSGRYWRSLPVEQRRVELSRRLNRLSSAELYQLAESSPYEEMSWLSTYDRYVDDSSIGALIELDPAYNAFYGTHRSTRWEHSSRALTEAAIGMTTLPLPTAEDLLRDALMQRRQTELRARFKDHPNELQAAWSDKLRQTITDALVAVYTNDPHPYYSGPIASYQAWIPALNDARIPWAEQMAAELRRRGVPVPQGNLPSPQIQRQEYRRLEPAMPLLQIAA